MKRGISFVGVLVVFVLVAASASAQKVGNPTDSLGAVITGGSWNFSNQKQHGAFSDDVPLLHDARISKDGSIDIPMADLGPVVIPFPDSSGSSSGFTWTVTNTSVTVIPTADATGSLNPFTGLATLDLHFYLKGTYTASAYYNGFPAGSYSPSDCRVGDSTSPPEPPLELQFTTGTTSPPAGTPNKPITGTRYSDATGRLKLVDNTFALPPSSGCDPQFGGITFGGFFNGQAGLPSPSGSNTLIASAQLSPIIKRGVQAKLTATPTSGLAPLTVHFDASKSFVPAGVKSYAFTFGDGSHVTNTTGAVVHKYVKPGTYTATVTVTDNDGDHDTAKLRVIVRKACTVPNVVGKQLSPARSAILAAGCKVGTVTKKSSSKPAGVVLSESPAAGKRVLAGTSVALAVSR